MAADCDKAVPLLEAALKTYKELYGPRDPCAARLLYELGFTHRMLDHPNLAEPLFHRSADRYRESFGVRHRPRIVSDLLFELATIHEDRGDFASAVPLFSDARVVAKEMDGPTSAYFCNFTLDLSRALIEIGEFERARALLDENLAKQQQIGGTQGESYARTLHGLFVLSSKNSDPQQAETYFKQAEKIFRDLNGDKSTWAQIELHIDWGAWLAAAGKDPKKALEQLEWGRKSIAGAADRRFARLHQLHVRCLRGLALAYLRSGEFDKGEVALREAIDSQRKRFPGILSAYQYDVDHLAILLGRRAHAAMQAGKLTEYVAIFQKVVDTYGEIFGQDSWRTRDARSRLDVARKVAVLSDDQRKRYQAALADADKLRWRANQGAEAVPLGQQTLAALEELIGKENVVYQRTVSDFVLAQASARNSAAASEQAGKLIDAAKRILGPDSDLAGWTQFRLGQIERKQGHYQAALAPLLQGLAIMQKAQGDRSPTYGICLYLVGSAAIKSGNLRLGGELLRNAHSILSQHQGEYLLDYIACLLCYAEACYSLNDNDRAELLFRRAYSLSNRLLAEASELSASSALSLGSFYAYLGAYKKAEPLLHEGTEKRRRLSGERSVPYAIALTSLANLLRDQGDVLLPGPLYDRRVPSAEHKGQWKVESRFLAFVVRRGRTVERIDLGAVEEVSKEVDAWLKANDVTRPDGPATLSELARLGRPLRKRLWDPLEKSLEGADVVLVSPDGAIARFPLGALPGVDSDSFLVEERALATVPVPAMLPQLLSAPKTAAGGDLVAFGDVAYGGGPGEMDREGGSSRGGEAGRSWLPGGFTVLKNTGPEADDVASRFALCFPKGSVTVLKGERATEDAFRRLAAKSRWVHLATHGVFDPQLVESALATRPSAVPAKGEPGPVTQGLGMKFHPGLMSALALAGANVPNQADEDDGILSAMEVAAMDLSSVELAVLSACHSAQGKEAYGEGVFGLQRAFQVAGSRSVIATQWPVEDTGTRLLMMRFYRNLWEKKMPKLEALCDAQRWMISASRKGAHAGQSPQDITLDADKLPPALLHPGIWAPFVLSGDWR